MSESSRLEDALDMGGMWKRAGRDTARWLRSILFLLINMAISVATTAIGGSRVPTPAGLLEVTGLVEALLFASTFLGIVVIVFSFHAARAPIRQRNEARATARQLDQALEEAQTGGDDKMSLARRAILRSAREFMALEAELPRDTNRRELHSQEVTDQLLAVLDRAKRAIGAVLVPAKIDRLLRDPWPMERGRVLRSPRQLAGTMADNLRRLASDLGPIDVIDHESELQETQVDLKRHIANARGKLDSPPEYATVKREWLDQWIDEASEMLPSQGLRERFMEIADFPLPETRELMQHALKEGLRRYVGALETIGETMTADDLGD